VALTEVSQAAWPETRDCQLSKQLSPFYILEASDLRLCAPRQDSNLHLTD